MIEDERDVPSAPTEDLSSGFLRPGQVLGERYRIGEQLGRGGMGEVWRAFDLKLRVEVALKAMREDLFRDEKRRDLLRREVRAAREVVSPNVCRIFDLIEAEGRELVSMEYVDGGTLLNVLRERGPLDLKEAQDIASQFLAGLEAIHKAGLIHRDVKPENIMLTRAGRVVLMDFGLARQEDSGAGTVSGTPAYMAPEQAAGLKVDARADVYSSGVVLAEMVSPEGINDLQSRESVWEGIRHEPARVPDSPWAPVLKKAVAKQPDQRYRSAHTLTRALEDVTLRVEGAEDLNPYPGLASFTESDAEYFFGREAEIEAVWAKLDRPHMLAIVGPSGAGKTSFIRAGVVPNAGSGWAIATCTPGAAAFRSLRQELADQLAGDAEAVRELVDVEDLDAMVSAVSRWRRRHEHALLIIDQFEELFTQNPDEEQARFADLLGRLVLEADVFVLLSLRDDFFFHCHRHEALKPVVTDLTLLGPPTGGALRRALVRPAAKCGYRFEDDELVEEMLADVEGERGALPLLAFAMSRMWEARDRENGLITRRAHAEIGGVGGALAQHAEGAIDSIGNQRVPIVRELFRNLVTAEGTRAVREWHELVSVFGEARRSAAEEVLRALIDARLLTSYEVHEEDGEPVRQVEIIHESLLANWPRLVRWQTQDAEGAQLRDELRQAARAWDERERPVDRLWTGTAYREYRLWRERYPGGLTEVEEAFGAAMTRHAERRKRRRRLAAASTIVALLAVLAIVGGFWRNSLTEARRAEAANLFSLAQLCLEESPSESIAHAIASLELADSPAVRRLAQEALWRGPTEMRLSQRWGFSVDFSPDGRWLAKANPGGGIRIWPSDGGPSFVLESSDVIMEARFGPDSDLIAANLGTDRQALGLWSVAERRLLRTIELGGGTSTYVFWFSADGRRVITYTTMMETCDEIVIRSWPVDGGPEDLLARLTVPPESLPVVPGIDPAGSRLSWADGSTVRIVPARETSLHLDTETSLEHERTIAGQAFDQLGQRLATADTGGTIRIWSLAGGAPVQNRTQSGGTAQDNSFLLFDPSGSKLANAGGYLWDLTAPAEAEPFRARFIWVPTFHPSGRWFASGGGSLWPLARTYPRVLHGHERKIMWLEFTPDGEGLISSSQDGTVRLWPVSGTTGKRSRVLYRSEGVTVSPGMVTVAPDGSFAVATDTQGGVTVIPLDGGPVRRLPGFSDAITLVSVAPGSRLVAAGAGQFLPEQAIVRVWDLESDEVRVLDAGDGVGITGGRFTADGDLLAYSKPMLRRWRLTEGPPHVVWETELSIPTSGDFVFGNLDIHGRHAVLRDRTEARRLWVLDLETGETRELPELAGRGAWVGFGHTPDVVFSGDRMSGIRVGPVTGEPPHLLLGHEGSVGIVKGSPDGRWIASGGEDMTIRLWPMPDLAEPPLHTLPREELIAKLKTLTNLRVVRDPESTSGWKLEVGPFPGWETVPTW